jgi:hypothetical protein
VTVQDVIWIVIPVVLIVVFVLTALLTQARTRQRGDLSPEASATVSPNGRDHED